MLKHNPGFGCKVNRHHQPSKHWKGELQEQKHERLSSKQGQYSPNDQHQGICHRQDKEHQYSENKCLPLHITHSVVCATQGSLTETCWEERGDKQHPWYLFTVQADGSLMHGWARSPGVVSLEPGGLFYQQTCGTDIQLSFSSSVVSICSKTKWTSGRKPNMQLA